MKKQTAPDGLRIITIELKLSKREAEKIGRVKRWEERSKNCHRLLGPRRQK